MKLLYPKILKRLTRLLYQQTILLLFILLAIGSLVTIWNINRFSNNIIEYQASQNADLYIRAFNESRALYLSEVVDRVREIPDIEITHQYDLKTGAIPVPATFLIELGERIQKQNNGLYMRLYSPYPFHQRQKTGGMNNEFEERAWDYLTQYPNDEYKTIETFRGRRSLRYAKADIMKPSCVNCHNNHPDSPKRDWRVGDVRGIIEITQSLDTVTELVNMELQGMSFFLTSIFLLVLLGLFLVVNRLRQNSKELELKVIERTRDLAGEREKSEKLLRNILPKKIVENLKDSQDSLAEHFSPVTILFADIVGFTALSTQLHPLELVDRLNQIFSTFDRLAERYGLEKIKTIGDAYMVVGGLPVLRTDHAAAIANIALEMQNEIRQFSTNNGHLLKIRIGINTGAVVAGVIGKQKFAYDLWGDAVNVASRMESTGEPDRIQVTEETYNLLKEHYELERRGEIEVKGKGKMVTYWLLGKKYTR
ncbi:MAG: DUF3365 domain-containing protein [Cyanobacteria bacterium SBLK]|nr:DUF3365 domain-containing protein [Cyanobacteria bacterium SBLK]